MKFLEPFLPLDNENKVKLLIKYMKEHDIPFSITCRNLVKKAAPSPLRNYIERQFSINFLKDAKEKFKAGPKAYICKRLPELEIGDVFMFFKKCPGGWTDKLYEYLVSQLNQRKEMSIALKKAIVAEMNNRKKIESKGATKATAIAEQTLIVKRTKKGIKYLPNYSKQPYARFVSVPMKG